MDVAMGALLTENKLRDALISGYTRISSRRMDIEQLEGFMFLAIVAYYAFLVSNKGKHMWLHKNIPGLIEHFCKPFLNGKTVFYNIWSFEALSDGGRKSRFVLFGTFLYPDRSSKYRKIINGPYSSNYVNCEGGEGIMSERFWKKLLKKGFSVELDQLPKNKQQFLDEIERYCIKEKVTYEFIERDRPAIISIDNVVYQCQVENAGRPGFVLHFKEM